MSTPITWRPSYREGNFNARFGAAYSMHEINSGRDVAFSDISERTQADASMRFAQGGDSFKVEGAPMARDAELVGAGVDMAISECSRLSANYAGQFYDRSRDHAVSLTYAYRF